MRYRFGNHVLDTATRTLTAGGEARSVEPLVFDLLSALIHHRDEVVSKDRLVELVWGGRAISDTTISAAVAAARRALGDDGRRQAMIRTAHGHGFRFVGTVETDPAAAPAEPPVAATRPSLAVLPFRIDSDDPEHAHLGSALAEDISAALSRMRWLFVVSFQSSADFAPEGRDAAARLGVRYLVSGNLRRLGGRLRVSCSLTEAQSGELLWSGRYELDGPDLFALQDRIADAITLALNSELTLAEISRARRHPTGDFDAWNRYMTVLPRLHAFGAEDIRAAIGALEVIIADVADFAPAHAALAWCYGHAALHGWVRPGQQALEAAARHAGQAIRLDPGESRAHCALALVRFWEGRQQDALASADRAIELEPNLPEAHGIRGNVLAISGRPDEAIAALERALSGSPRDPGLWFWQHGLANARFAEGAYDAALDHARRITQVNPSWVFGHVVAAASAAHLDRQDEARRAVAAIRQIVPDYGLAKFRRQPMWARPSDIEALEQGLRLAGLD